MAEDLAEYAKGMKGNKLQALQNHQKVKKWTKVRRVHGPCPAGGVLCALCRGAAEDQAVGQGEAGQELRCAEERAGADGGSRPTVWWWRWCCCCFASRSRCSL